MKNLEQLMASFLCRKDFLDPEGTKSGGVPHIQLSESIKIRLFDDLYQLDAFYLGTYFKLKPTDTAPVWVRDHFDRATQTYACHKYEDSNHETFLKGNRDIYINFTF